MLKVSSRSSPAILWVGGIHVFEVAWEEKLIEEVCLTPALLERVSKLDPSLTRILKVQILSAEEMEQRFGEEGSYRIVSRIRIPPLLSALTLVEEARQKGLPLLLLEEIKDPQNLGSIARAIATLGGVGLILTRHRTVARTPAAFRASSGYLLRVPCAVIGGAPNFLLKIRGRIPSFATVPQGGKAPWELSLSGGHLLIFGQEGRGLKRLTIHRSSVPLTIPMVHPGDSLNVAQCASLLLYEARRQRLQVADGQ